jgi:hypothetical protein
LHIPIQKSAAVDRLRNLASHRHSRGSHIKTVLNIFNRIPDLCLSGKLDKIKNKKTAETETTGHFIHLFTRRLTNQTF